MLLGHSCAICSRQKIMGDRYRTELEPRRQQLLEDKFVGLLNWSVPEIMKTVGPYEPRVFETYNGHRHRLIGECSDYLLSLTEAQVDVLVTEEGNREDATLVEWVGFKSRELQYLRKRKPPWYAGGFGHPEYVADFDYWCKMPSFDLEEALCLSIGIDPRHFKKQDITNLKREKLDSLFNSLQFLVLRHEQLRRQFDPYDYGDRITPRKFIQWATRVEFDAHPEFIRLLEKYNSTGVDQPTLPEPVKRTDPREVDTMAKLFTAIAIVEYGYDPGQQKSPIPKQIADLIAESGMGVSDDTVRKYLKHGAQFLPKDWKPTNI